MPQIDLRSELPPLGYNAQDVPLADIDFAAFDLDTHRLDNPRDPGAVVDVFAHPKHLGLVARRHSFDPEDASTEESLHRYLRYTEAEHTRLAGTGITVMPSRHLEATLPVADTEGVLFSLSPRLPLEYEHLDPSREDQIASNLFVLKGLTRYAKDTLTRNPLTYGRFLSDIFEPKQYSALLSSSEAKPVPILHDTDPMLDETYEDGKPSLIFRRAVGELKDYAEEVMATAYKDPAARVAYETLRAIQTELPKPYYF